MARPEVYGERRAAHVVAVTTARRAARQGLLWGLVFGATIAATEIAYFSSFPTEASRRSLAESMQGNTGFEAVFGQIREMGTVAGYTQYKSMFTLVLLASIWGLLLATRVSRGEEDSGRWELFLAGRTTRGHAALQAAYGLAAGLAALWAPTALLAVAAGSTSKVGIAAGDSLVFATAVAAAAATFMAVGLLAGQLAATRHDANVLGAAVLAGSYLVRMAADSDPGLSALRWLTPLGWIEEIRPLTDASLLPFVPLVALVAALLVAAMRTARRRDLGESAFPSRDTPRPHTILLGGQAGLTLRLTRPAVAAWLAALATTGVVFGLVAQAAGNAIQGSPGLERVIERLGGKSPGAVAYLGFVFVIAAGIVAIAVAGQVSAMRNEEASGQLDNLLVRPVARWKWLAARLGVGVGLVLGGSALAGVTAWLGAASQRAEMDFGDLLEAGLNTAPPAVFVLGIGALAFGLWPRGAIGVTYGLVVWSFLAETLASISDSSGWLRNTSPLLHMTPAPAADPNWGASAWLAGIGLLAALVGIAAFGRRDLQGA
jgi:ABC-2 type transport system permease protein